MKKRIISLLLVLSLVFAVNISASAKSSDCLETSIIQYEADMQVIKDRISAMTTQTEVEVTKNNIHSTYRHIKIQWDKLKQVNGYHIQISSDKYFRDCVVDHVSPPRHQLSHQYSSASITKDIGVTYYIRVRGVFDDKIADRYIRSYGVWSDTVIAEGE